MPKITADKYEPELGLKAIVTCKDKRLIIDSEDTTIYVSVLPHNGEPQPALSMNTIFIRCDRLSQNDAFPYCDGISGEVSEIYMQLFMHEEVRQPLRHGPIMIVEHIKENIKGFLKNDPKMLQSVIVSILKAVKETHTHRGNTPFYFVYFANPRVMPEDEEWYETFRAAGFNVFHVIQPLFTEETCYLAIFSSEANTPEAIAKQSALSEIRPPHVKAPTQQQEETT